MFYKITFHDHDGAQRTETVRCADVAGALGFLLDTEDDFDAAMPIRIEPQRNSKPKARKPVSPKVVPLSTHGGRPKVVPLSPTMTAEEGLDTLRLDRARRLKRARR